MLMLNNSNMRCVFQYYAVCIKTKEVKYILNVKHNLLQMLLITMAWGLHTQGIYLEKICSKII